MASAKSILLHSLIGVVLDPLFRAPAAGANGGGILDVYAFIGANLKLIIELTMRYRLPANRQMTLPRYGPSNRCNRRTRSVTTRCPIA
jgi:hypothetical protein